MKSNFGSIAFPIYRCGAADAQSVGRHVSTIDAFPMPYLTQLIGSITMWLSERGLLDIRRAYSVAKKRRTRSSTRQLNHSREHVYQTEYEITSEPLEDARYKRLPQHVQDAIERLYALAQSHPREAIPDLLQWIAHYPSIPMLYNYLSLAYSRSGNQEKAEQAVLENYQRNPDYLFARVNYAEICLAKQDYQKVADIFEHKFDLHLLYPKRKRFHVTEFAGFMGVIGRYFLETGNRAMAEKIYDVLVQVAPDQPLTRRLRRKLYPNLFQRLVNRILSQPKSDEQ